MKRQKRKQKTANKFDNATWRDKSEDMGEKGEIQKILRQG